MLKEYNLIRDYRLFYSLSDEGFYWKIINLTICLIYSSIIKLIANIKLPVINKI